ncbi:MAG: ATP-binding cassette domain-containing protein [Lachnospiraceae bacterium]|nr:ATP-binding cassette domain-containing protein [Lachnospiraceae bacterium]
MSFIQIEHLSKTYKGKDDSVHALNDINLNIEKGEIYGIIGLSGAGKSTLVRCINLLERPCEGKIIIDGKNMPELSEKELREERRKIAMIFQQFNLLMQRNVLDNVCFPMEIAGIKRKEARLRAKEYLKTVEIAEKAKAYPVQLSGGQKQRVAIARALASNPEIILCDEATSALDPQTTGRILKLLKQINEDYGITVVIITHEMRVIEEICGRVAVLDKGNLVEEGPVSEVFKNPKSKAAKRLLLTKELSEEGEENGLN